MAYLSTYSKFRCNKCCAVNWIYEGDINDLTCFTGESGCFKCWNCGEIEQYDYELYCPNNYELGIKTEDL